MKNPAKTTSNAHSLHHRILRNRQILIFPFVPSRKTIPSCLLLTLLLISGIAVAQHQVGDKPQFNYETTAGLPVTSDNLQGKLVVLHFWASWCNKCRAQTPRIQKLDKTYAERGVQFIGMNLDRDLDDLKAHLKEEKINWPQIFVSTGKDAVRNTLKEWGVRGIPHAVILSPDGEILWRGHPTKVAEQVDDLFSRYQPVAGKWTDRIAAIKLLEQVAESLAGGKFKQAAQKLASCNQAVLHDPQVLAVAGDVVAALEASPQAMSVVKEHSEAHAVYEALASAVAEAE